MFECQIHFQNSHNCMQTQVKVFIMIEEIFQFKLSADLSAAIWIALKRLYLGFISNCVRTIISWPIGTYHVTHILPDASARKPLMQIWCEYLLN